MVHDSIWQGKHCIQKGLRANFKFMSSDIRPRLHTEAKEECFLKKVALVSPDSNFKETPVAMFITLKYINAPRAKSSPEHLVTRSKQQTPFLGSNI